MLPLCLFIAALCLLGYTYAGYSLLMSWRARLFPRAVQAGRVPPPRRISIVLSVKNEEARITPRLENLLACRFEGEKEIVVVCDGCTDGTAAAARAIPGVVVLENGGVGKAASLNAGIARASSEIVVLCDARQEFAENALEHLIRPFGDPSTGAVSGALGIAPSADGTGEGLDTYWSIEKKLRYDEATVDSSIGCTGAIYAIRRNLHRPIPADTLLDDVVIPMQIAQQGYRVLFVPEARAWDPQPLASDREAMRKRRTLAGNFQMLFRYPGWLLPWRHRLWFGLLSHKYLRLAGPLLLAVLLGASALLAGESRLFMALFLGQAAGYVVAGVALLLPPLRRFHPIALGMAFLFLQVSILRGFAHYLRRTLTHTRSGWA